jgi:hypothetical protein
MTDALRVNVITSCTGRKLALAPGDTAPAERLYCGQHHIRLMRGVDYLRATGATVNVWIVSAGHGLVHGTEPLAPYEKTFQGRGTVERNAMASQLGIPQAVRAVLAHRANLTVVLLGEDYLHACQIHGPVEQGAPTLVFASASASLALSAIPGLHVVALGVEHTRQFAAGLVALKGEVGGRLLAALADGAVSVGDVLTENALPRLAAVSGQSEAADATATLF